MIPFLDSGFLLTLLMETGGSALAWQIAQELANESPLRLSPVQTIVIESNLLRTSQASEVPGNERALAAAALARLRWYLSEGVFLEVPADCEAPIQQARAWQLEQGMATTPILLLWPAFAVSSGATHFLSFDPRTRQLAAGAGLALFPEKL